jgi:hypothetical protein
MDNLPKQQARESIRIEGSEGDKLYLLQFHEFLPNVQLLLSFLHHCLHDTLTQELSFLVRYFSFVFLLHHSKNKVEKHTAIVRLTRLLYTSFLVEIQLGQKGDLEMTEFVVSDS